MQNTCLMKPRKVLTCPYMSERRTRGGQKEDVPWWPDLRQSHRDQTTTCCTDVDKVPLTSCCSGTGRGRGRCHKCHLDIWACPFLDGQSFHCCVTKLTHFHSQHVAYQCVFWMTLTESFFNAQIYVWRLYPSVGRGVATIILKMYKKLSSIKLMYSYI